MNLTLDGYVAAAGDQHPDATAARAQFARNWRDTPTVVFSSTLETRTLPGGAVLTRYEARR
ncbi:hypothetical protein [Zhihengliuella sp.]|nr:hypothetical protein [Zhihengliuella sp.]